MASGGNVQPSKTFDGGPTYIQAQVLTGTGSSQTVALDSATTGVRLYVETADAHILFGDNTVTVSAATGVAMPTGIIDVARPGPGDTHMAYIGNTASINFAEFY